MCFIASYCVCSLHLCLLMSACLYSWNKPHPEGPQVFIDSVLITNVLVNCASKDLYWWLSPPHTWCLHKLLIPTAITYMTVSIHMETQKYNIMQTSNLPIVLIIMTKHMNTPPHQSLNTMYYSHSWLYSCSHNLYQFLPWYSLYKEMFITMYNLWLFYSFALSIQN